MIGNNIKYLRLENNWTQPQLARLMQVSNGTISVWENSLNEPKASYIVKLANVFGVSTDYLLGVDSDNSANNVSDKPSHDNDVLNAIRKLDYAKQQVILSVITMLTDN